MLIKKKMKTYHKKSCQKLIDFILIIHQIIIKKKHFK